MIEVLNKKWDRKAIIKETTNKFIWANITKKYLKFYKT